MPLMSGAEATARIEAFQCIGCGRIESPQPCIGICEDRKVEFVYAAQHDAALVQLQLAAGRVRALEKLIRRIAWTTPRAGEWERSYRALQNEARRTLAASATGPHDDVR